MTEIALAVVVTLLLVSLAANAIFFFTRHRFEAHWFARETRALDRARAAELRAGEQIDAMLDRIDTSDRLQIVEKVKQPEVDPEVRKAWFDEDDDTTEHFAWNKVHGEPVEDEGVVT